MLKLEHFFLNSMDDKSITLYSNAELTFDDIPADAWCAQYVKVMQAAGIVNGIGNGKYNPNGTVTWAHVLTILSRFVEPQKYTLQNINYNSWAVKSVQTAVALGSFACWLIVDRNLIKR